MSRLNDKKMINDIRSLSLDMIHEAGSGHPGIALGAAPLLYTLFTYHLNIDLNKGDWCNRDRFVLSCGHASSLLYAMWFFFDESKYNLNDLKNYRNLYSKTPGHPEYNLNHMVDATTGPLGEGIAMAVGMAMAGKYLESYYHNKKDRNILPYHNHCPNCFLLSMHHYHLVLLQNYLLNNYHPSLQ